MEQERQRIDKWLWHARAVKSRTLATRLVEAGHVRLNGKRVTTPARGVGVGDVLTIALEHEIRVWRIIAMDNRRGPFRIACRLYEDIGAQDAPSA